MILFIIKRHIGPGKKIVCWNGLSKSTSWRGGRSHHSFRTELKICVTADIEGFQSIQKTKSGSNKMKIGS